MDRKQADQVGKPFTTSDARKAMLEAIRNAEASGIDGDALDRMRLACEFFTNPEFRSAMNELSWEANQR